MSRTDNPRLNRLDALVGAWELTAHLDGRTLSTSRTTFGWLDDRAFLVQRSEPPTYLAAEWQDAAPQWVDAVIGLDDYSDAFTMLYNDSRGVSRVYGMTLDGPAWTMRSRPGVDFHQRFEATIGDDGAVITGAWEASTDGKTWSTDFDVTYRRLPGG